MPALPRLNRSFFARSVHEVAPDLIGATLLVNGVGGRIVEVEAYHHTDPAAHSFGGQTAAQCGDVRAAGLRLRLSVLRHPLVPELRLRGGRLGQRGADPGARADRRHCRDAAPARLAETSGCCAPGPASCARRSASPSSTTGCRSTGRRSSCAHAMAKPEIVAGVRIGITKARSCRGATG